MAEYKSFFTEEEAEETPPVLIHKAKLKATTEEQARRKSETEKLRKERIKETIGLQRRKQDIKALETVREKATGTIISIFAAPFRMMRGQRIVKLRKPVHPDKLIKNKELYLGSNMSEKLSPIGRRIDNPMELYFGTKTTEKDSMRVLGAIESGAPDVNNISIMTGLNENRVIGALKYLQRQGYDIQFLEEM